MAPQRLNFNSRTLTMPIAAFCMASILFVYARTSIQSAKRNAQKHREADGGQISWRNETMRRHGVLEPPEQQESVKQLLEGVKSDIGVGSGSAKEDVADMAQRQVGKTTMEEEKVRQRAGKVR